MHGQTERSRAPRRTWVVFHLALLILAGWILVGDGYTVVAAWFGFEATPGDGARRVTLLACGLVLWMRMSLTALVLLSRRFGWQEMGEVSLATAFYQIGFALLGAGVARPIGMPGVTGAGLFALGSFLNTGSEIQRKRFKDDPRNRGRLYTGGLFGLARHINYFGDALWATGWALLTGNPWALLVPVALTAGFVFYFIPALSSYLEQHYGDQYADWRKRTKAFVPFVY